MMIRERMGQLLMEAQLVSEDQIQEALRVQRSNGSRLGSILVQMGVISEATLLEFLSQQYGVSPIDLSCCKIEPEVLNLVPLELAQQLMIMPVRQFRSRLALAMIDPSNIAMIDEMKFRTGLNVTPLVAMESDILAAIRRFYQVSPSEVNFFIGEDPAHFPSSTLPSPPHLRAETPVPLQASSFEEIERSGTLHDLQNCLREALSRLPEGEDQVNGHDLLEDKAPIVNLVNRLLRGAEEIGASDVHFEPTELFVRVRFRLDGVLGTVTHLPKRVRQAVVARIKIMASLDIAERRLPQDGRMKLQVDPAHSIDVRVSVLPCLHGEKVVLRLLDRSKLNLDLNTLGFEKPYLESILSALENPYGMILVTGPTGSGKTTTLYSALHYLNTPFVNIVTVEDPVEYHLNGINQMQIKEDIGLTFATGLRSFLRQDPDIIMIGEIRDQETANIAVQSALTGHRVFSTLHTNDAPSTITRLLDMGIEPFLVSSSLSLIIAQRLVRKNCDFCKERDVNSPEQLVSLGFDQEAIHGVEPLKGRGCVRCHQTGFSGRVALFEILPLSQGFHQKILSRAPAHELKAAALQAGIQTLRQSGLTKIQCGVTTIDEVASATTSDHST
jgi:type IV pilus assembly protein PilB